MVPAHKPLRYACGLVRNIRLREGTAMYARENFRTKKALREAVAAGKEVTIYAPALGTPATDGIEYLEGPHYPEPHTWYAQVTMKDGKVVKVK